MRKISILFISVIVHFTVVLAQTNVNEQFIMWTSGSATMWDNQNMFFWGFSDGVDSPTLPGPILYANEGDSVFLDIRNQSQVPHTVHLHGLDVNQENDGVPQLSQQLNHAEQFIYKFKATHAGTYLYHCHVASIIHVQMGMYGNVVIRARDGKNEAWTNGPVFDSEKVWLMSEMDKSWHDNVPDHHTIDSVYMEFTVPDYNPDYFFVNGKSEQQLQDTSTKINGSKFERIYCRVSNVGYLGNRIIFPSELNAEIIASDGRPLPTKIINDTLFLAPGERYGVMVTANADFTGNVGVQYVDLNNYAVVNTQQIPVDISGTFGINEHNERIYRLYPNPFNDNLNVQLQVDQQASFQLINALGEVLLNEQAVGMNHTLTTSQLKKGIYLLQLTVGTDTFSEKVIKR